MTMTTPLPAVSAPEMSSFDWVDALRLEDQLSEDERMLRDATSTDGLNAVALRYFNAAGASQDGEIGEDHRPETHLVPLVLDAARDPTRRVGVFGTDYPTPDGSCVRDYVHVEDLASAHVRAVELLLSGGLGGFTGLNLGSGQGLSVLEVVEAARRTTGAAIPVTLQPRRRGDPAALVADAAAARRLLGWEATRSDADTILRSAWCWLQRQGDAGAAATAHASSPRSKRSHPGRPGRPRRPSERGL